MALVKFPRTPHLDDMGAVMRDDLVMSKSDALNILSRGVVIEEKVDGANLGISFASPDGPPRCQKRGGWVTHQSEQQFSKLDSWLARHTEKLRHALGTRYILYGEWVAARHSVPYDALPDWFLAFDVYDKQKLGFLSSRRRDELLRPTGVRSVPAVTAQPGRAFRGPSALETVRQLVLGLRSALCGPGSDQWAEGVCLRLEEDGWLSMRAKLVHPAFRQAIEGAEGFSRSGGGGVHWSKRAMQWNRVRPDLWHLSDPNKDWQNEDLDPETDPDPGPKADQGRQTEMDGAGNGAGDARPAATQQVPAEPGVATLNATATAEARVGTAAAVAPLPMGTNHAAAAAAARLHLAAGGCYVALVGDAVDSVADTCIGHMGCVPPGHVANRVRRDGLRHHITLVTPPEMAELRDQYGMEPQQVYDRVLAATCPTGGAWVPIGLGRARGPEAGDEAFFVVVGWPAGRSARAALGLRREQHFHITLGFQAQDVHGVPKGISTLKGGLVDQESLAALCSAAETAGLGLTPWDRAAVLVLQVLTELHLVAAAAAPNGGAASTSVGTGGAASAAGDHCSQRGGGGPPGAAPTGSGRVGPPALQPNIIDSLHGLLQTSLDLAGAARLAAPTEHATSPEGAPQLNAAAAAAAVARYGCSTAVYGFVAGCARVALARLAGWCGDLDEVYEHVRHAEALAEAVAAADAPGGDRGSLDVLLAAAACLAGKAHSQRGDLGGAAAAFTRAASALERAQPAGTAATGAAAAAATDLVSQLRLAVTPSLDPDALRRAAAACSRRQAQQPQPQRQLRLEPQSLPSAEEPTGQQQQQQQHQALPLRLPLQADNQLRNPRARTVVPGVRVTASVGAAPVEADVTLPRNTSWVVSGVLAGGSTPKRQEQIAALRRLGVGLVVTLTQEEPLPADWFTAAAAPSAGPETGDAGGGTGVRNLFVPVPNYEPPSVQQMDEILAVMEKHVATAAAMAAAAADTDADVASAAGGAVLVHCGGGKGRAGTVLACYLCKHGQAPPPLPPSPSPLGAAAPAAAAISALAPAMSADAAVRLIRNMRPGSIETEQQRRFVGRYCDLLWQRYDLAAAADMASAAAKEATRDAVEATEAETEASAEVAEAAEAEATEAEAAEAEAAEADQAACGSAGRGTRPAKGAHTTSEARPSPSRSQPHRGPMQQPLDRPLRHQPQQHQPQVNPQQQQQQQHPGLHQPQQQHERQRGRQRTARGPPQPAPPPAAPPPPSRRLPRLAVLVGLPGSGKSTFAAALEASGRWSRICQDECGSRGAADAAFSAALLRGPAAGWLPHVVLDRCSPDAADRREWLRLALLGPRDKGIVAVFFDVDKQICKARVAARSGHPTIAKGRGGSIVDSFAARLQPPNTAEGFERVHVIRDPRDAEALLAAWGAAAPPVLHPGGEEGDAREGQEGADEAAK